MYSSLQITKKYLAYYLTAANNKGHGIHSPFVFDFIHTVLNDTTTYPEYQLIEERRMMLLKNNEQVHVTDLGAGSKTNLAKRTVSSIARSAVKSRKYSQLLFRIAKKYKPRNILELGTSLGITTSYLAVSSNDNKVYTIEGLPEIAEIAKKNFQQMRLNNVHLETGNFDEVLPGVLKKIETIDLCFIDGNHRKVPTLSYFNQVLAKSSCDTIIILDDIHWSEEMEQAWDEVRRNGRVKCTIDLFFIGIVFFREEFHSKQHFTVRY